MELIEVKGKDRIYSFNRSVYAPVESNMYILIYNQEAIIFDAIEDKNVSIIFKEHHINKVHLFLTHEHYDHTHGISYLKENFNVTLYCNELCSDGLSTKKRSTPILVALVLSFKDKETDDNNYQNFKENYIEYEHKADVVFTDEKEVCIANHIVKCIHTPGHSPGSSIYILDDMIAFTGDSLIKNTKVITKFRGGDYKIFKTETLPIIQALLDDIIIMPGHGESFIKKEFNFDIYNV